MNARALLAQLVALDRAMREGGTGEATARRSCAAGRPTIATLADGAPSIPVSVFSDGVMLYRGPFRPFGSEEAAMFVTPVMAGYLPNELQQRHPEGFVFTLHDHTSKTYADAAADAAARRAASGAERARGLRDLDEGVALLAPVDADAMLRRLPASVISERGELHAVRAEVAALIGAPRAAATDGSGRLSEGAARPVPADQQAMREARLRRFDARA